MSFITYVRLFASRHDNIASRKNTQYAYRVDLGCEDLYRTIWLRKSIIPSLRRGEVLLK